MADQVPCPHCFELNHYRATKCAHCLDTTWREGEEEPSGFALLLIIAVVVYALASDQKQQEVIEPVVQQVLTTSE